MQIDRDVSLRLDGQVGDAACRVQHARLDERVRWAGIETPRAACGAVGFERLVGRQPAVHEQRSDTTEGYDLRIYEVGVFSEPAEPRAPGEMRVDDEPAV